MQCIIRAALVYEYSTATGLLSKQTGEEVKGPTSITQGNDLSISHQGHPARTNTFFPAPSPQPPLDLQSILHMTQSCLCTAPSSLWLPSSPRTKSQSLRLAFEALPGSATPSFRLSYTRPKFQFLEYAVPFLPQGLCTGCSPCPECFSPDITNAHSLSFSRPLLKHHQLSGPFQITYLKRYPPPSSIPCSIFLPGTHRLLIDHRILYLSGRRFSFSQSPLSRDTCWFHSLLGLQCPHTVVS